MTRRTAFACVLVVLLLASAAHAQTIRWTMANEYPATSIQGEADARFTREVGERSSGRIAITNQFDAPNGARSKEILDAVARGALPLGNIFMGAVSSVDPVFQLTSLPFLASTAPQGHVLADVARSAFDAALARRNQKLLFISPWPAAGLWTKAPVTTADGLKGLRVRTSDASSVLVFKALGAIPTQVSFADAIPMLRAGQLDAVVSSGDGGAGSRFAEVLRSFTAIEYAVTMSMVTINADAWRALEPPLQQAVLAAAAATEAKQWEMLTTRVAANYAQMRAAGVGIIDDLSPDFRQALRAAAHVAIEDWLTKMGPAGPPLLDTYRKALARH